MICLSYFALACASGEANEEGGATFGNTTFGSGSTFSTTTVPPTTSMGGESSTTEDDPSATDTDDTDDTSDVPMCGNNVIEPGEFCDGTDLAGRDCESLGYSGGTLACSGDCSAYDISGCTVDTCGNGVIDEGELCDGPELQGQTCESIGFAGGQLGCNPNCLSFNTDGCTEATCGNNVAEGSEVCDGADLNGQTCASQGFPDGGTLSCNPGCDGFNVGACNQAPACGNGVIDVGEQCDGNNLNGQDCVTGGFAGGTLQCSLACQYDASLCHDGDCCTDNLYPGCESAFVQDCVCGLDPYCCDNFWDSLCVQQAVNDCQAQCL